MKHKVYTKLIKIKQIPGLKLKSTCERESYFKCFTLLQNSRNEDVKLRGQFKLYTLWILYQFQKLHIDQQMSVSSSGLIRYSSSWQIRQVWEENPPAVACSLLMGTLHSRSMMAAAFFIRTIIIGFTPLTTSRASSAIKFLKLHFFCFSNYIRNFWSRRQEIF